MVTGHIQHSFKNVQTKMGKENVIDFIVLNCSKKIKIIKIKLNE